MKITGFTRAGSIIFILALAAMMMVPGLNAVQDDQFSVDHVADNGHETGHGDDHAMKPQSDRDWDRDHDICDRFRDTEWCKHHHTGRNSVSVKLASAAATSAITQITGLQPDFSDWSGATAVKNTTYYDVDGVESAYSFDVMANGVYDGYVMVSATRDNYPVVEFSKGITPDKDPATLAHAQVLAQGQITSPREVLGSGQPVYLGPTFFDMAYPVEINPSRQRPQQVSNRWIVVDLNEGTVVNQTETVRDLFQFNASQMQLLNKNQRIKVAGANAAWAELEHPGGSTRTSEVKADALLASSVMAVSPSSLSSVEVSGVPFYHWRYGCSPTSAAMILGYWRDQGLSQLPADTDAAGGDNDHGDPLNHELALAMHTTIWGDGLTCPGGPVSGCGSTWPWDIDRGINTEFSNNNIHHWYAVSTPFNTFSDMEGLID